MNISYDITATLRADMKHHEPIVLIYDARGNGGGTICPTITGDHMNRITDYTAVVVEEVHGENLHGEPIRQLSSNGTVK